MRASYAEIHRPSEHDPYAIMARISAQSMGSTPQPPEQSSKLFLHRFFPAITLIRHLVGDTGFEPVTSSV